jgi:hypothetical protein
VSSQRGANKLGFYFGALVEYAARFCPAIGAEAVTLHRQVASGFGAGKMVGQLKLVIKRKRRRQSGGGNAGEVLSTSAAAAGEVRGAAADDDGHDTRADNGPSVDDEEIVHWEYNVKYFVDGGSCCPLSRRKQAAAAAAGIDNFDGAAAEAASIFALAPPPTGDSCYVGPFLHENLQIRVQEARRKLALAVGLYMLHLVVTHSLKAPGFNPCTYKVISWFQAFAFTCNVYRYLPAHPRVVGLCTLNQVDP